MAQRRNNPVVIAAKALKQCAACGLPYLREENTGRASCRKGTTAAIQFYSQPPNQPARGFFACGFSDFCGHKCAPGEIVKLQ